MTKNYQLAIIAIIMIGVFSTSLVITNIILNTEPLKFFLNDYLRGGSELYTTEDIEQKIKEPTLSEYEVREIVLALPEVSDFLEEYKEVYEAYYFDYINYWYVDFTAREQIGEVVNYFFLRVTIEDITGKVIDILYSDYSFVVDPPVFTEEEAIDAAKNSSFVKEFLAAHPNANVTVLYLAEYLISPLCNVNNEKSITDFKAHKEVNSEIIVDSQDHTIISGFWQVDFVQIEKDNYTYISVFLEDETGILWSLTTNYLYISELAHSLDEVLAKAQTIAEINNYTSNENVTVQASIYISFFEQNLYDITWYLFYSQFEFYSEIYGGMISGYYVAIDDRELVILSVKPIIGSVPMSKTPSKFNRFPNMLKFIHGGILDNL